MIVPMPNILMLLSKSAIGDTRVEREARSLSEAGYQVKVFSWRREAGDENKPVDSCDFKIDVIGPYCRKRNFVSFLFKLPMFWISCIRSARGSDFSAVHSHDFDTLPAGLLISKLHGIPLVYDAHESYADMISSDVPEVISKLTVIVQRWLVRKAELVVVANDRITPLIDAREALVVLNCPSVSELSQNEGNDEDERRNGAQSIGYFGTLEPGRFVFESIDAVRQKKGKWKLMIAGDGTLSGEVREISKRSVDVEYLGRLDHDEVMKRISRCDLIHVILDPSNRNYIISTPLRMFEAMGAGRPSVVTAGTYAAEIVQRERCGLVCEFNIDSILELLDQCEGKQDELRNLGARGKSAFEREYNWETQVAKMIDAYRKLLS